MDNIIFSANAVVPIMFIMLIGYLTRRANILSDHTTSQANSLAFKIFLPILLFNNTRDCTIEDIANPSTFTLIIIFVTLSFAITTFIIVTIEKDNKKRGVMIQGICRSNYALFGIPLVSTLFPNKDIALASVLIAIVIPMFNVYSVAILTYFGSKKADIKSILMGIITNPLIIATALGIVLMFVRVEFPYMVDKTLRDLGGIASPFALFMLGARFNFSAIGALKKQLAIVCLGRLIILPAIVLGISILLGFRGVELACVMVVFASPTATSSYTMAEKMGGNGDLASSIVVFTSTFSILTVFAIIYTLKMFAFL